MKHLIFVFFLFNSFLVFGQIPQLFTYQAIARGSDLKPMANADLDVTARLLLNGAEQYSEKHNGVKTGPTGLFVLAIGSKNPNLFSSIDWGQTGKYELEISATGDLVLDKIKSPLQSVPFALMADAVMQERQQLKLEGDVLSITGSAGNSVTLPLGKTYTSGQGIALIGNVFVNTGDLDATDDLLISSIFDGDVTGKYNDLQIKSKSVGSAELSDMGATLNQVLKWNGSAWVPGTDNTTSGTGSVSVGATLSGNGSSINPLEIARQSALTGNVLKWNGTSWSPGPDNTGQTSLISSGAGLDITGNASTGYTLTNTGDTNALDDLTTNTNFGGANSDVSGTYTNLQLATNSVSANEIASNAVNTAEIADAAVTAPKLASMGAASGQVLKWNGTNWAPAADGGQTTVSVNTNGLSITGNASTGYTLINTGDTNASDDLTTSTNFLGDVSGIYNNLQLGANVVTANEIASNAITTLKISDGAVTADKLAQMNAAPSQVLKWDGTKWIPSNDQTGSGGQTTVTVITPGLGISGNTATGYTITNTGDTNASDDLITSTNFLGDVSGLYNNLQLGANVVTANEIASNAITTLKISGGAVTADKLAQMNAAPGQVLKWSGTNWAPAADNTGGSNLNLIQGTAISITGTSPNLTINNTGDTNASDDLTVNTTFGGNGGDITGTYDALQIKSGAVGSSEILNGSVTLSDLAAGVIPTALPPNGTAMGDLNGNYPNPLVVGIQNRPIASTAPTDGQVLRYSSGNVRWEPATLSASTSGWNLDGNSNTNSNIHFVGTTNNQPLNFKVNNVQRARLTTSGILEVSSAGTECTYLGTGAAASAAVNNLYCSFFGARSGAVNAGVNNSFFGAYSGNKTTSGFNNCFFGYNAGLENTIGESNCFFGLSSGKSNTNGQTNSFFGKESGLANTTGYANCFFGIEAGKTNASGFQNTCIGAAADVNLSNISNSTALGYNVKLTSSNTVIIGNSSVASIGGYQNFTKLSDARFKSGLKNDVPGLDFILKLKPISYQFEAGKLDEFLGVTLDASRPEAIQSREKAEKMRHSGFLAQEVEATAKSIGYDFSGVDAPDNDNDTYGLRYAEFTVPLVKAVQEQQVIIQSQQTEIDALKKQLADLQQLLNSMATQQNAKPLTPSTTKVSAGGTDLNTHDLAKTRNGRKLTDEK